MEEMCNEIRESLDTILDYHFHDEQKHYEEENDISICDDDYNNPDGLPDKEHIFYHILVLQQWMNQ